jgi:hypothetical protein
MAIFKSSVVWGLFEYTAFLIAPQKKNRVHRDFWITLFFRMKKSKIHDNIIKGSKVIQKSAVVMARMLMQRWAEGH